MKMPFDRPFRTSGLPVSGQPASQQRRSRKSRKQRKEQALEHESLEQRAMMAIYTHGGGPLSNYLVVASDEASDVYVQQRADFPDTLLIADNSSFLNYIGQGTNSPPTAPDILYVTNGASGAEVRPLQPGDNRSAGLGYQNDARLRSTTYFSLSNGNIILPDYREDVFGNLIPRTNPAPTPNPVPFQSDLFFLETNRPPIRGVVSYGRLTNSVTGSDRWEFEVVPNTSNVVFRPAEYDAQLNVTLEQNVTTVTVSSAINLQVGQRVFGNGIPQGTTVTGISGSVVTLSRATTQSGSSLLGFVTLNAAAEPIDGSVSIGQVLSFPNGFGNGQRAYVAVNWSTPVSTALTNSTVAKAAPPVIDRISYGYDDDPIPDSLFSRQTETNISASPIDLDRAVNPRKSTTSFDFDVTSLAPRGVMVGIIPGTLTGTVVVDNLEYRFRTDFVGGSTLYFARVDPATGNAFPYGDVDRGWVRVAGTYSAGVGSARLNFDFTNAFPTTARDDVGPTFSPEDVVDIGNEGRLPVVPRTVELTGVSYLAYVRDPDPNSFTVFAGHDLTSQLHTELLTPASVVNIDSRVAVRTTLTDDDSNLDDVVLRATTIRVSAETASRDAFRVEPSRFPSSKLAFAMPETLLVDAAVAAPTAFFIKLSDDPATSPNPGSVFDGPLKGLMSLSQSGSFSGALASTADVISTPSQLVTIDARQTDLYVAGQIFGTRQNYLLNSTASAQALAPYVFSSRGAATEAETGLVRGDTVSITLGNDASTPLDGDIAFNTLDLNTQIESLRIKAATRQQTVPTPPGESASGPFPYNLSIREKDDISIDAVAASGLPLAITSGGNMRFTSALATASDVTLQTLKTADTPSRLTVSAPLSTTKGKIRLIGDSVTLNNSVLVTGADDDEYREDIWITANAGDVSLNGLVSAVNQIKIEQFNPLGPTESPYSKRDSLPLPDTQTVTQTLDVLDDFSFDNLDVEIDMTHTFVGDLTGTLIAPDGRRFRLFDRNGGNGDNFAGTIFDSEATTLISQGAAPFTGRFRPVDSLAPLYGSSSLGKWRLEIRDNAGGDSGILTNFTLRFQTLEPQVAKVSGPARVVADTLLLDVQGEVGNSQLLPADTSFYLRTDVDTLTGSIGRGASVDELNDIHIPSLRAGGFVSLRAGGVDPTSGANSGNRALRANLVDITGLDVSAPNGSLDVFFDTSKTIELGNARGLRTGRSLNSLAAGDVTIRSNAGSIVALDAPLAGGNARSVRVATAAALQNNVPQNGTSMSLVTYSPGNPGVTPSTLRGRGNLNTWLGVQIQPLRAGDRVLVKDQAAPEQNGVYAVSFMSTPTWTPTTTWTLTRALDSDTATELPGNSFVRVGETQANNVNQVINQVGIYQLTANYIPLNGLTLPGAIYDAATVAVTVSNTAHLSVGMAVFGPGISVGTTIESIVSGTSLTLSQPTTAVNPAGGGALKFVAPTATRPGKTGAGLDEILITELSTTSDLRVGMLVVGAGIPTDTVITRILNGSTVVISNPSGLTGSRPLSFVTPFATRTGTTGSNIVRSLSTTGDLMVGMVVVGPGIAEDTTITSINADQITLSRVVTAPQTAPLTFLAASPTNFGRAPITVVRRPVKTDIGSHNPNSNVTFVVSTNAGTNNAAGSLGKMISLRQQNIARLPGAPDAADGSQTMNFRFSASMATNITPIRLTQELPEITKAFTISASPTYPGVLPAGSKAATPLIDGSRITQARSGRNLAAGDTVSGLVVRGPDAGGTIIRNVNLGGFAREVTAGSGIVSRSAAIEVIDAAGVLVSNVTLGAQRDPLTQIDSRLSNSVGVRFTGAGTTSGTLLNSNVFGNNNSGLVVENDATGVTVVGSTFGRLGIENAVGARFESGTNRFGVEPVSPVQALPEVLATRVSAVAFTVPAAYLSHVPRLVPGVVVQGPGIQPTSGNVRPTIARVTTDARGITTVTLNGGSVTASAWVGFTTTDPATIASMTATRVASDPTSTTFTLPAASRAVAALLYAGLPVMGPTIQTASASAPATIAGVAMNLATGVTTVTIRGGTITGNGVVTFGHVVYTELNGTVMTLPASVDMNNLYLGQPVSGLGIAAGSLIRAINHSTREIAFANDQRFTRTGFTVISFAPGGRNTVTQNRTGLVLAGGATTVTNSTITANTFSGIEVTGVNTMGSFHSIGTSKRLIATSNHIHSNGAWGILFREGITDAAKNNQIRVQGNFLGTTSSAVVASTLANRRGNIGHRTAPNALDQAFAGPAVLLTSKFASSPINGIDSEGNQHGRYQGPNGGSTGTGGVR